jgi:hypothetical protein
MAANMAKLRKRSENPTKPAYPIKKTRMNALERTEME